MQVRHARNKACKQERGKKKKDKISKMISGNNDSFVYLYNTLAFNSSVAYPVC